MFYVTMREDGTVTFQESAANQGSAVGAAQFRFIGIPALAKRMIQSGWTAVHAAEVEQLATGRLACLDVRPAFAGQQMWPGRRRQAPAWGSAGSRPSAFEQMLDEMDEMDEMEAAPSRVLKKPRGQDTFCCACGVRFEGRPRFFTQVWCALSQRTHATFRHTGPLHQKLSHVSIYLYIHYQYLHLVLYIILKSPGGPGQNKSMSARGAQRRTHFATSVP